MARKKVKLAYIENESSRKSTYKKRKRGMLKKLSEITTLCDIPACAILYSPYDNQPVVWPNEAEANRLFTKFVSMPEVDKNKKMLDQESLLRKMISKTQEQLMKVKRENYERAMTRMMFDIVAGKMSLQGLKLSDFNDLKEIIQRHLSELRIKKLKALEEEDEAVKITQLALAMFDGNSVQQSVQQYSRDMERDLLQEMLKPKQDNMNVLPPPSPPPGRLP